MLSLPSPALPLVYSWALCWRPLADTVHHHWTGYRVPWAWVVRSSWARWGHISLLWARSYGSGEVTKILLCTVQTAIRSYSTFKNCQMQFLLVDTKLCVVLSPPRRPSLWSILCSISTEKSSCFIVHSSYLQLPILQFPLHRDQRHNISFVCVHVNQDWLQWSQNNDRCKTRRNERKISLSTIFFIAHALLILPI